MVMDLIIRFLIGGVVVSFFAILGDALKPKSFAGLISAAPSVALATIGLTVLKQGKSYATIEAQSMVLGATAVLIYACVVSQALIRKEWPVLTTTSFHCWRGSVSL
jgi:uncharacterized membrane protein (GlpM family)